MYPVQSESVSYPVKSAVISGEHQANWDRKEIIYRNDEGVDIYKYECTMCDATDRTQRYNGGTTDNPVYFWGPPLNWQHGESRRYWYVKDGVEYELNYDPGANVSITSYYYNDYAGAKLPTTQSSGSVNGGAYYDAPSLNSIQSAKLTAKSLDGGNLPANTAGKYIYVGTLY